jgi:hypothetical protein
MTKEGRPAAAGEPGDGGPGQAGRLLKLLISGAAVAVLARQVDERSLAETLAAARPWPVAGAFALYLMGQAVTAWRWDVIARASGFDEPRYKIVAWYFIGMFFNLFGPSTLGGDVVRSLYLAGPTGRRSLALHTVVFDRLSGLTMLVAVALTALLCFGTFGLPDPVVYVSVATGAALVAGWWALPLLVSRVLAPTNRVRRLVEADLRRFWRDGGLLARTAAISVFFHVLQIVAVMLVGRAVGLGVPWPYYFVFHPLVSILSALPLSLAGLGIREVGYVWFLSTVESVPHETAAAFALLWLAVLLASSGVGGLVFLAYGGTVPVLRRSGAGATRAAR